MSPLKHGPGENEEVELVPWLWGVLFEEGQGRPIYSEPTLMEDLDGLDDNVRQVAFPSWNYAFPGVPSKLPNGVILTENGDIKDWNPSSRGANHSMISVESLIRSPLRIAKLSTGHVHFAAVSTEGVMLTFGIGANGRLGHGGIADCLNPTPVAALAGVYIMDVACGADFTLALSDVGDVYSTGSNSSGVTGHGTADGTTLSPRVIRELGNKHVSQIAAGDFHAVAVVSESNNDGDIVYGWGTGTSGELGNGNDQDCHIPTRMINLDGMDIVNVSLGLFHTGVVTKEGQVLVTGGNNYGQLGLNDLEQRNSPMLVETFQQNTEIIAAISFCGHSSVALTKNGDVYEW